MVAVSQNSFWEYLRSKINSNLPPNRHDGFLVVNSSRQARMDRWDVNECYFLGEGEWMVCKSCKIDFCVQWFFGFLKLPQHVEYCNLYDGINMFRHSADSVWYLLGGKKPSISLRTVRSSQKIVVPEEPIDNSVAWLFALTKLGLLTLANDVLEMAMVSELQSRLCQFQRN